MCLSYHRHSQQRVSLAFAKDSLMSHVTHIYMWDMSYHRHSQERGRFTNESCHTHERAKTHWMSYVTRINEHVTHMKTTHTCMSHVAHTNESCRTYEWVMSHIWTSHVIGIRWRGLISARMCSLTMCSQYIQPVFSRAHFDQHERDGRRGRGMERESGRGRRKREK